MLESLNQHGRTVVYYVSHSSSVRNVERLTWSDTATQLSDDKDALQGLYTQPLFQPIVLDREH